MSSELSPRRAYAPHQVGFPLRLDLRGRTTLADDENYLKGLIEQVLFTGPAGRGAAGSRRDAGRRPAAGRARCS